MKNLLKECAKMKEFDHPNVLKLRGVCLDGGPAPYIIMPFMTNGSLQSHLKENRASLVADPTSNPDLDDLVSKHTPCSWQGQNTVDNHHSGIRQSMKLCLCCFYPD